MQLKLQQQHNGLRLVGCSIYNHDTTGGVVINADDTGIVTGPPSGVGVQIESDGADIFLNVGGSSNKVDVNGNV